MKRITISLLLLTIYQCLVAQSVGIGTSTPNTAAQLDITSTTKGILIPRMTDAEKNAIASPVQGLILYNTNTNSFQYYNGAAWVNMAHSGIVSGAPNKVAKFNSPWGLTPGMMTDNGAGVGLNTTNAVADASSVLDLTSTSKGLLVPRLTTVQKNAIAAPAKGLMVFDSTANSFSFYNGTAWTDLNGSGSGSSNWSVLGNNIYNNNTGNVGIGASTPFAKLTVNGDAVIANGLGLATTTPDLLNYKLDVNGNARIQNSLAVNDPFPDYNLDVNGNAGIENLGVGTPPDPNYLLKAGGTANLANLLVPGTANINGTLNANSNLVVDGSATIHNGGGVAYNPNSGTNLKIAPFTTGDFFAVLGPHAISAEGSFALPAGFSSTPRVFVGDIDLTGGTTGQLYMVELVVYGCTTTSCKARLINHSAGSVNYSIRWNMVAIGN